MEVQRCCEGVAEWEINSSWGALDDLMDRVGFKWAWNTINYQWQTLHEKACQLEKTSRTKARANIVQKEEECIGKHTCKGQ